MYRNSNKNIWKLDLIFIFNHYARWRSEVENKPSTADQIQFLIFIIISSGLWLVSAQISFATNHLSTNQPAPPMPGRKKSCGGPNTVG